jgi:NAD-dependent SIR2 family protein deacetylase
VQYSVTEPTRLYSILSKAPKPAFLLGAGASVKSGVPLAGEVVERAAKWAYAHEDGREPEDPRLHRSDWFPWLEEKHWYNTQKSPAENYAAAIQHLLQPRQNRKRFFRRILDTEGIPPSSGYEAMAEMMAGGIIDTVLTTNFDTILLDACDSRLRPQHVEGIKTESDRTKFSTSPPYPQIVYLHGSVEHYTDKNIVDEVQQLDEDLAQILFPLLRDHPLIVVGYRGGEPSVMKHLLIDHAEQANLYRHGIYWCVLKRNWKQGESLTHQVPNLV